MNMERLDICAVPVLPSSFRIDSTWVGSHHRPSNYTLYRYVYATATSLSFPYFLATYYDILILKPAVMGEEVYSHHK
jgi:hypothetical protein